MKELLSENPGYYILSGKFSQDLLEQHFSAQQIKFGSNPNPNTEQFRYNELALHPLNQKMWQV